MRPKAEALGYLEATASAKQVPCGNDRKKRKSKYKGNVVARRSSGEV
jgi:hypothetical protein